jgi:hypothetical protein
MQYLSRHSEHCKGMARCYTKLFKFRLEKNKPPVCAWYETYVEVTDKIVQLAEQLELEVDANDVEESTESHGNELSNEDLIDLEAAKVAEATQTEASEEPEEES